MELSPGPRVPLRSGPFGWTGALGVAAVVLAGAWALTGSLWRAAVAGVSAAVTWYAVHRLADRDAGRGR